MSELERLAYGVLLPVLTEVEPEDALLRFLDQGGKALLFGEYADEYQKGRMRPTRKETESAEIWQRTLEALRRRSGELLAAADADITAVNRFEWCAPSLPSLVEAQAMTQDELEGRLAAYARVVCELGVNIVFSPTADVVAGDNPWLAGKTLGGDLEMVERLVSAYVRGIRRGGVMSALKHFPGHPTVTASPSQSADARVVGTLDALRPYMAPFASGIRAGADGVMMGPAIFEADDPPVAASISPTLIHLLKTDLNFTGLIITCDLDHKATQRGSTIEDVAVAALKAGADLLLLSPGSVQAIPSIASAISLAVSQGQLDSTRLHAAAQATLRAAATRKVGASN